MPEYKRNQVEAAIAAVLDSRSVTPSLELRTRLKRLLDTDRAAGIVARANEPERSNYAFYSAKGPGTGVEVWFSDYEVFALLNGLQLMTHGWPQGFAVSVMRRVRPELEKEFARILKQDPRRLFDDEAILSKANAGGMAFNNMDPVLLTIVTKSGALQQELKQPLACAVCRGPEAAMKFFQTAAGGRGALTMVDVVGPAHSLTKALAHTEPQHRGRS